MEATLANMITPLKSLLDPFPVLVLSFSIRSLSSPLPSWSRSMWWSSFSRHDLDDCHLLYYANTSRDITSVIALLHRIATEAVAVASLV